MNFILLTDYFHPIIKSGSIIVGDLAEELIRQGHKITIVTFVDNQTQECEVSINHNLQIVRIRSLVRQHGMIGRLMAEKSYSNKVIKYLKRIDNIQCDGIICYAPSIFYGKAIKWLKNKYHSKAYLVVRDIFPKWVLDSGLLKKGVLYSYFKRIEKNLYESIDVIGIEANADLKYFKKFNPDNNIRIEVLNNWGSVIESKNTISSDSILQKNRVNIVYGGNTGDAQDLLSLIKMIDNTILEERAVLIIMGSGNQFNGIRDIIDKNKLNNIILMPLMEREKYLSIMKYADIGLVSLSSKMLSNNYPLKMIGYMQLGKPILASVNKNNEIVHLINDNKIGLVSEATNKKDFNNNLNTMISNNTKRKELGKNGLKLFHEKFTVESAVSQIYNHFL